MHSYKMFYGNSFTPYLNSGYFIYLGIYYPYFTLLYMCVHLPETFCVCVSDTVSRLFVRVDFVNKVPGSRKQNCVVWPQRPLLDGDRHDTVRPRSHQLGDGETLQHFPLPPPDNFHPASLRRSKEARKSTRETTFSPR